MPLTIVDATASDTGITATIELSTTDGARRTHTATIRADDSDPVLGDALLCLSLLAALATDAPTLAIPADVDATLHTHARDLVEIFRVWLALDARVTVEPTTVVSRDRRARTAAFFSAGADSFHTVLRRADEIDELYFVLGFDIPAQGALAAEATARTQQAADDLGLPLVVIDTPIRALTDGTVPWAFAHGSLLAAVAHSVGRAGRVLVASSLDKRQQGPWGSHAVTDPRWSSAAVEIVADGTEASRLDKLAFIADHDVALRHLRVCFENDGGRSENRPADGPYNCGRCSKCLETMLGLHLVGALHRCPTLPHDLDTRAWDALAPMPLGEMVQYVARSEFRVGKLRDLAQAAAADPTVPDGIVAALRRRLAPFDRFEADPGLLERAVADVDEPASPPPPKPAGYRLADTVAAALTRYPSVGRVGRRAARTVASWTDRIRR